MTEKLDKELEESISDQAEKRANLMTQGLFDVVGAAQKDISGIRIQIAEHNVRHEGSLQEIKHLISENRVSSDVLDDRLASLEDSHNNHLNIYANNGKELAGVKEQVKYMQESIKTLNELLRGYVATSTSWREGIEISLSNLKKETAPAVKVTTSWAGFATVIEWLKNNIVPIAVLALLVSYILGKT